MNWYKKARLITGPFEELDRAYKKGKRASKRGEPVSSNPYPKPKDKGSKSHTPYSSWIRGWMTGTTEK